MGLKAFILKGVGSVGTWQLTDGQSLEGLRVAELSLTLPVDGGHPDLVRRVGLQSRQHHRRWTEIGSDRLACDLCKMLLSMQVGFFFSFLLAHLKAWCVRCNTIYCQASVLQLQYLISHHLLIFAFLLSFILRFNNLHV